MCPLWTFKAPSWGDRPDSRRLVPGATIRGLVSFGFGHSAPGRSRTCVPGFGRRRRIRWTTRACGGGCRIRTCAGALTPTTVFKTVALPGSANPPYPVVLSRCQESNLVRCPSERCTDRHAPPRSYAEGARIERAPELQVPDHGLAIRCLATRPALQLLVLRCPSRIRTSVSASKARCPCHWTNGQRCRQPAYPPRTRRPVPLPGFEPGTSAFVVRRSVPAELQGRGEDAGRLHRRSAWPPHSATGTSF